MVKSSHQKLRRTKQRIMERAMTANAMLTFRNDTCYSSGANLLAMEQRMMDMTISPFALSSSVCMVVVDTEKETSTG